MRKVSSSGYMCVLPAARGAVKVFDKVQYFSSYLHLNNLCCGYSLELPQHGNTWRQF